MMNEVIDQQPNIPGYIAKKIKLSTTEMVPHVTTYLCTYLYISLSSILQRGPISWPESKTAFC